MPTLQVALRVALQVVLRVALQVLITQVAESHHFTLWWAFWGLFFNFLSKGYMQERQAEISLFYYLQYL